MISEYICVYMLAQVCTMFSWPALAYDWRGTNFQKCSKNMSNSIYLLSIQSNVMWL